MINYPNPHGPSCPWYDITESQGAPNIKWCEETLCQWVSEPANTWSNLSYLIFALVIIYLSYKNRHHKLLKQFGPIIFFMGAMSFFYHMSNFYGSQILDFVGMFFFVGWVIGFNLVRLGKIKGKHLSWFNLGLASVYTIAMHIMYLTGFKFQVIIILSAFLIITTELAAVKITKIKYTWFLAAIVTLGVAFGFSVSDNTRMWCDPSQHGWFSQGHAMWHWVAGLAMLFIYLHYSQEALKPKQELS
jgi:hypothetical protein